jgi:hypothetical protein
MKYLKNIALAGNIIFIFWIIYNGVDEGFRAAGRVEVFSLISLLCLLLLNIFLLFSKNSV